jgi:L-2-hydroxyglutarate oxidase LhgO
VSRAALLDAVVVGGGVVGLAVARALAGRGVTLLEAVQDARELGGPRRAGTGIRASLGLPGDTRDFQIAGPRETGAPGCVALYGIESPGLTASLAIAERVRELV